MTGKGSGMKDLESLPDGAHITVNEIAEYYSLSVSTIWDWVGLEKFPEPKRYSQRCTRWRCGDVRRAMAMIG